MKFGVLGGGFGLYGYLPALLELNKEVYTLKKYKSFMEKRHDLRTYINDVKFISNEQKMLDFVDNVVIARKPNQQLDLINQVSKRFNHIFFEKPLAEKVSDHVRFVQELESIDQSFSVAYLIKHTEWYREVMDFLPDRENLEIKWKIKNPIHSWKNLSFSDQGLFSFYGIHTAPLVHELSGVKKPIEKCGSSSLIIRVLGRLNLTIFLSYGNENAFTVKSSGTQDKTIYSSLTPFGNLGGAGIRDSRIDPLKLYIIDSLNKSDSRPNIVVEKFIIDIRTEIDSQITLEGERL
jgi:hypothetical protein